MQRFILIIVILAAAMSGFLLFRTIELPNLENEPEEKPIEWQLYTPHSRLFTVKFPAPVQHVAENMQDDRTGNVRRYNLYVSQDLDASIFTVTTITYVGDENIAEEPEILEDTVNEILVSNPNNQMLEKKQEMVNGHRAIEFRIRSGENILQGLTFAEGDMLYILTLLSNKEERLDDFRYFVDSFKVVSK